MSIVAIRTSDSILIPLGRAAAFHGRADAASHVCDEMWFPISVVNGLESKTDQQNDTLCCIDTSLDWLVLKGNIVSDVDRRHNHSWTAVSLTK